MACNAHSCAGLIAKYPVAALIADHLIAIFNRHVRTTVDTSIDVGSEGMTITANQDDVVPHRHGSSNNNAATGNYDEPRK